MLNFLIWFNFVEIMAPIFSREAYCVWHLIQNDLVHGWGLDFALSRRVERIPIVGKPLVDLYAKNEYVNSVWLVFEHLCWHNSVSFVAMISGLSRNNLEHGALNVFIQMLKSGITPTPYAFSVVLCLNLGQSSKLRLWECWHFNLGQKGLLQALGGYALQSWGKVTIKLNL
ncbi:hypothetical protein GIB67_010552 [Kingdonia uniflora]|uniref:Pentatricopeptide repeat-containing protein n=1 Tax=Kingdonia uniflora TaxID=39325 RepID=A0A7J7MB48_9MAGN|nr:hypothetical protein GIB67_010552 [Kingdonia uniflora]